MADPFIAEIRIWGTNFNPMGWYGCDGSLISISQSTALFALLGTNYGGNGQTTFGLPNLNDRAPVGYGLGTGLTDWNIGNTRGVSEVTLLANQLPMHKHSLSGYGQVGDTGDPQNNRLAIDIAIGTAVIRYTASPDSNTVPMASDCLAVSGGGAAHENRQPSLAMRFCIAFNGLFPSRN